jgi:hypothetical protein
MFRYHAEKQSLITALDFSFLGSLINWLYNFLFLWKYTSQWQQG